MEPPNEPKTRRQRRELRRQRKAEERAREVRREGAVRWVRRLLVGLVLVGAAAGFVLVVSSQRTLPPTTDRGHTETSPASHVLTTPMQSGTHKHMLEHADGSGPPGVILNYNCEDFECEDDLLERLERHVEANPDFVYLAPYPTMDAKLVLTRLNRQQVLDAYDEAAVAAFIDRR